MSAEATAANAAQRRMPRWAIVAISVLFGLFYAYAVWNAVDFLIQMSRGILPLNPYGWFVLLFAAAFPLIAFGAAFAIGWRRSWWQFALVLLAGLAVVAVFWLNILAYTTGPYGASLLG